MHSVRLILLLCLTMPAYTQVIEPDEPEPVAPGLTTPPLSRDNTRQYNISIISASYDINARWQAYGYAGVVNDELEGDVFSVGVEYDTNRQFFIRLAYFDFYQQETSARPDPEDRRLRIEPHWRLPLGERWQFVHRSRLERRYRDTTHQTRYRPRFSVSYQFSQKINLDSSVELYYDLTDDEYQTTLYAAGLTYQWTDQVSTTARYIYGDGRTTNDAHIGLFQIGFKL